ncbi:50S ribosomal protein L24 [Mycoplasmatota bacterium]|nr:50S ribosomal protein L24 [Mycoplasmatota bacterium]
MYIKTGDTVAVISGRDQFVTDKKGNKTRKTGRVLKVYPKLEKVLVEGVNMVKKHERPKTQNDKGGIMEVEAPLRASNVAIIDPKTGEPTRVGYRLKTDKNGRLVLGTNGKPVKVRYAKKSGASLDD